jgi:RHS repeat-associated protein
MVAIDKKSMPGSEVGRRRTQPLARDLYQGMTMDAVTGLYDERARDYSPSLGRWMEQDPAQFINGANMYQFVNSSPVGNVDAQGLAGAAVTGSAVPAPPSTPGTSPAKPPGSGTVGAGATTGSVPTGLPGADIKVGAGGTVSTGGTVTGRITGAVTKNLGNGTTVTAKVTAKAKDNLAKNPKTPNVSVGVKCTLKSEFNDMPFEVYIGGKTYNLDSPSALSGATITGGVSTDNPTGPNVGVGGDITQAGNNTTFMLKLNASF